MNHMHILIMTTLVPEKFLPRREIGLKKTLHRLCGRVCWERTRLFRKKERFITIIGFPLESKDHKAYAYIYDLTS